MQLLRTWCGAAAAFKWACRLSGCLESRSCQITQPVCSVLLAQRRPTRTCYPARPQNGFEAFIFVGKAVAPQTCQALFGELGARMRGTLVSTVAAITGLCAVALCAATDSAVQSALLPLC